MSYDSVAFRTEHKPVCVNHLGVVFELESLVGSTNKVSHFELESKNANNKGCCEWVSDNEPIRLRP
jgi:hypothetical protein